MLNLITTAVPYVTLALAALVIAVTFMGLGAVFGLWALWLFV